MQIVHTEGEQYYGWGQVFCQTCRSGRGKEIAKEFHGYDVDALTIAEINTLLEIANEHARKEPSHSVKVYTFSRAKETNQTGF